ncbi:MAG: type II toxin-antitoxin system Phd/YefM family antitoxin [Tepidiformaceae bacterium]
MSLAEASYTFARGNLAAIWDRVVNDREVIILKRRGAEPVAMIAADELRSLLETAYLLSSPANAERLIGALRDAKEGHGIAMTVAELRRSVGLDDEIEAAG